MYRPYNTITTFLNFHIMLSQHWCVLPDGDQIFWIKNYISQKISR